MRMNRRSKNSKDKLMKFSDKTNEPIKRDHCELERSFTCNHLKKSKFLEIEIIGYMNSPTM